METPPPRIASFRELMDYLREDYRIHSGEVFRPGLQALAVYRFGVWVDGLRWRWVRAPLRILYHGMRVFCRNVYGIELYFTARIGRRLTIGHQNGIVIHYFAEIGDDCTLVQGVTIGGVNDGVPVIGNRVFLGPGAVVAGNIRIGDDVRIGPNAVVLTNVPAGAIVAPPQSRIMTPPPRRAAAPEPGPRNLAEIAAGAGPAQPATTAAPDTPGRSPERARDEPHSREHQRLPPAGCAEVARDRTANGRNGMLAPHIGFRAPGAFRSA